MNIQCAFSFGGPPPFVRSDKPSVASPGERGPGHHNARWPKLAMVAIVPAILCLGAAAQNYSTDWSKVAGGGGTSSNAQYVVSGTIGQPDAGVAMSGGSYSLTGGFWSLVAVVETVGLPNLSIGHSGNSIIVSWPNTESCMLQTNNNLATVSGWKAYGGTLNTSNGTNSITISPPTGKLFFRLSQP
jgi:hypothetical protein